MPAEMFDQKCQSNSSRLWWKQKMRGSRPVQTLDGCERKWRLSNIITPVQANWKVGMPVFFDQKSQSPSPSLRREGVSDGSEHLSSPAPTPPSARKSHRIIVIGWENFNGYNGKLLSLNFCKHNKYEIAQELCSFLKFPPGLKKLRHGHILCGQIRFGLD